MTAPENIVVRVTQRYSHAPEVVFDAWLDPQIARKFLFSEATGEIVRCEIDARIGGSFVFTDRRGAEDVEHTGEYLEIDRPRRLKFSFGIPAASPDMDIVTIDISHTDSGCELTLTTELLPEWAAYAGRTQDAWGKMLGALAEVLG